MIAKSSEHAPAETLPRKRSLFNKPSWSRPQALSNDTDLFHRSSQTYTDLAAETARARQRKRAKKEKERVRQNQSEERAGKRLRTSEDQDDEDYDSSSMESSTCSSRKETKVNPVQLEDDSRPLSSKSRKPVHSPKSLLKRYEAKVAASKIPQEQRQKPQVFDIIDLEDEEQFPLPVGHERSSKFASIKPVAPLDEDHQPPSDEEFPELARQAREKARRKRLEEDLVSATVSCEDGRLSLQQSMLPAPQADPILQILVTSDIENTVPLIISRKLSQRLKDVRLTWAKRQNFTTTFTDTVFLTWRGKRVFDVTTCRSLGVVVDAVGRISTKGGSWEEEGGQVHMEAMTTGKWEAYKASKRGNTYGHEGNTAQEKLVTEDDHEAQVRIILKAKGLEDFKLQVRPSTLVSKIINAFRSRYQIGGEKDVFLSFDGGRLSPNSRVEETELSDMDTLEVYAK